jgi:hypothetical protein
MESSLRAEMESLLGAKFGEVRLHGGPEVDTLTQRVRANAFTQGQHVFLRSDRDPQTDAGRETLVHELSAVGWRRDAAATNQSAATPTAGWCWYSHERDAHIARKLSAR